MSTVIRWIVVAVLFFHGVIHLLGAAKGLGWAEVSRLAKEPGHPAEGIAWLAAAALVLIAVVLIALGRPSWWWVVAAVAAVFSQAVIFHGMERRLGRNNRELSPARRSNLGVRRVGTN
jgi:uncharacterized membrane protein YphA (DoxX/SURF4 family)